MFYKTEHKSIENAFRCLAILMNYFLLSLLLRVLFLQYRLLLFIDTHHKINVMNITAKSNRLVFLISTLKRRMNLFFSVSIFDVTFSPVMSR